MDCPNCGTELTPDYKRIKFIHRFGKTKGTLKAKTKLQRVFFCPKCDKTFALTNILVEVEVVN